MRRPASYQSLRILADLKLTANACLRQTASIRPNVPCTSSLHWRTSLTTNKSLLQTSSLRSAFKNGRALPLLTSPTRAQTHTLSTRLTTRTTVTRPCRLLHLRTMAAAAALGRRLQPRRMVISSQVAILACRRGSLKRQKEATSQSTANPPVHTASRTTRWMANLSSRPCSTMSIWTISHLAPFTSPQTLPHSVKLL